ncbi:hypothetical protein [Acholeplasma hippikon]|uniref:Uncharacterized protein n=1 Tax=Acholeplasma hippikon TaxID=264636 RepID=A0A449BKX3_9MOLU|nr:hypothetical protein [Acholeplasma hippikon]VEU83084.1 Uncharacterised protein [Acholeplasma hippikon]
MERSLRQRIMFVMFAIVLASVLYAGIFIGDFDFIISNLYLVLFLAALYMDHTDRSRIVLVLSAAVLIVRIILGFAQNPSVALSLPGIAQIVLYVALYLFAQSFLSNSFRKNNTTYMIIILALPAAIFTASDFLSIFRAVIGNINLSSVFILAYALIDLIFPVSIITYTALRMNRID